MDQKEESLLHSPNAMDPNWGGADYTQKLVDQGYYAGNEVSIQIAQLASSTYFKTVAILL